MYLKSLNIFADRYVLYFEPMRKTFLKKKKRNRDTLVRLTLSAESISHSTVFFFHKKLTNSTMTFHTSEQVVSHHPPWVIVVVVLLD
jgi:hypothetical protein